MRVLFTTWAWPSHLYALVPLAWALRAHGHDVRIACPPELAGHVIRTGLPGATVGRDMDAVAAVRGYARPPAPGGPRPAGVPRALRMFADLAESMAEDLASYARTWRPDLVVFEPTAWAGPLAAAAAGVPAVRHLYGVDLMHRAQGHVPGLLSELSSRLGVGAVDVLGDVTIDPCPDDLQLPTVDRRMPMRYVPYNGPGAAPAPQAGSSRRPRICVTWGTTMARLDPSYFLAGEVVAAVTSLGCEIVVAVTADQRKLLGRVPDGVVVAESEPLHLVLPGCALLIAHGGAGTLLTGLACGVPQVLIPWLPDHTAHARRLADTGAGMIVTRDEPVTSDRIRDAAEQVLSGAAYRAAAVRIQEEINTRPSPAALVPQLERLG